MTYTQPDTRGGHLDELAALRRVATRVAARADLAELYALVAEEAALLIGAEGGSVMRLDDARTGAAVLVGGAMRHGNGRVGRSLRIAGRCAAAKALEEQVSNRTEYPERTGTCCPTGFACHTAVAAPVHVGGRLWGVLMAASEGVAGRPAPGAEVILEEFAQLVAFAVDNAELHAKLVASARSDPLTGLANRRAFDEQLDSEVQRARRHDYPVSLAMIDIDHFKDVNDMAGHQAGDRLLTRLARALQGALRRGELLARIGGDELALILPGADTAAALRAAARMQRVVTVANEEGIPRVSLSIGICELADAPDVRTLIMRADNALYTAKHAGRATIRSWTRDDEPVGAQILARRHGLLGLRALARAADLRDAPTQRHSERVAQIVSLLAREAGWSRADVAAIIAAGVVHDVGKVAVPDAVLVKPAALDAIEYELVKRHAVVGAEITAEILDHAQTAWVRHHHERWDGRGYPDGLAGETIPLGARLLAIADALDVMVSARVYKPAMSLETALEECRRQSGQQFCPQVVAVLEAAVAKGAMRVPMA